MYERLTHLGSGDCLSIQEIPCISALALIHCYNCPKIVTIPNLPELKNLVCDNCDSLTKVPQNEYTYCSDSGCRWLNTGTDQHLTLAQNSPGIGIMV